jgi:hypothetical protein
MGTTHDAMVDAEIEQAGPTGPTVPISLVMGPDATIHQRLVAILAALPAIGKDAYNQQQQFHYRSHDQVLNALNPLLAAFGVFVVPYVMKRSTAQRATRSGGVMYEVNLHVQYEFFGLAGDSVQASAWGEGTDSGDKATNKAMTMAFKNVIAQVFAVSTEEAQDSDGTTPEATTGRVSGHQSHPQGQRAPGPPPGTPPATGLLPGAISGEGFMRRLAEAYQALDATIDWTATVQPAVAALYNVESRNDLEGAALAEYWRRMANAEVKLRDVFPPAGAVGGAVVQDEDVIGELQWAFDGWDIPALVLTASAQAALDAALASETEDIPFGEENSDDDNPEPAASD